MQRIANTPSIEVAPTPDNRPPPYRRTAAPIPKMPSPDQIIKTVQALLNAHEAILFAYIHGSFARAEAFRDVDVAVYLEHETHRRLSEDGETSLSFAIPLEFELEKRLPCPADVQVLNAAPLPFRFRAVQTGIVAKDSDPDRRADFEYLTRVQYFDFRPRREECLREFLTGLAE